MENEKTFDEEVIIEEEVSLATKMKNGIKKHSKKIAAVVVVGAVGLIGYKLGVKHDSSKIEDVVTDVLDDVEVTDF